MSDERCEGFEVENAPTFCEATCTCEIDGYYDEVRCTDRYGHEEEHSAKIWWSAADPGGS